MKKSSKQHECMSSGNPSLLIKTYETHNVLFSKWVVLRREEEVGSYLPGGDLAAIKKAADLV